MIDLTRDQSYTSVLNELKNLLFSELYGTDEKRITDGELKVGPNRKYWPPPNRELGLTRGHQWPVPPINPGRGKDIFPKAIEGGDCSV